MTLAHPILQRRTEEKSFSPCVRLLPSRMQRDRGKESATTKSHGRTITWKENINVATHSFSPITGNESLLTIHCSAPFDPPPFHDYNSPRAMKLAGEKTNRRERPIVSVCIFTRTGLFILPGGDNN